MRLKQIRVAGKAADDGPPGMVDVLVAVERRHPAIPWPHWAVVRLDHCTDDHPGWLRHPAIPTITRAVFALGTVMRLDASPSPSDLARIIAAPKTTAHDAVRRISDAGIVPAKLIWYRRMFQ